MVTVFNQGKGAEFHSKVLHKVLKAPSDVLFYKNLNKQAVKRSTEAQYVQLRMWDSVPRHFVITTMASKLIPTLFPAEERLCYVESKS